MITFVDSLLIRVGFSTLFALFSYVNLNDPGKCATLSLNSRSFGLVLSLWLCCVILRRCSVALTPNPTRTVCAHFKWYNCYHGASSPSSPFSTTRRLVGLFWVWRRWSLTPDQPYPLGREISGLAILLLALAYTLSLLGASSNVDRLWLLVFNSLPFIRIQISFQERCQCAWSALGTWRCASNILCTTIDEHQEARGTLLWKFLSVEGEINFHFN